MSKVLILGATGQIGSSLAIGFAREGYVTYGLVRNPEKAKELAKNEVFLVVGDIDKPETWSATAEEVDAIVDATANYDSQPAFAMKVVNAVKAASKRRIAAGKKPTIFVLTSGIWVYGGGDETKDETHQPNPAPISAWRPTVEQTVTQSEELDGIVIRPGCVYGRAGSLTASWFASAQKGLLSVPGRKDTKWALVHLDDLADAYIRAVGRADQVKGQIFIIANDKSETLGDCLEAVVKACNQPQEIKFVTPEPHNYFAQALALSLTVSNNKAKNLLGWKPRHLGFVEGVNIWHSSFNAHSV